MIIWVYSGDRPSNGAKALSELDGFKRCRKGGGLKPVDILVNWGVSNLDMLDIKIVKKILNKPQNIHISANKLLAFKAMDGHTKCVPWTIDHAVAAQWHAEGHTVVARHKLTGHSGDGIILLDSDKPLPDQEAWKAPLYTQYVKKRGEYRVHVFHDKVIDTQRKIRDFNREPIDWKVRSHQNGFIFARNNLEECEVRNEVAVAAVKALGLDFGAVDIIKSIAGVYYVLEVNTAPGLEGQTINSYGDAFRAAQE